MTLMDRSKEFAAGYTAALDDLQALFDTHSRRLGSPPNQQYVERWIEGQRRKAGEFGSDFTQTVFGSGTGPREGIRTGE